MSVVGDPVARVVRWVALAVGVVGLVVLVVGVVGQAGKAPRVVTARTLAVSLSGAVGSAPVWDGACGRGKGAAWGCEVSDHDGSGGASYDVTVTGGGRCWRATLTDDHSEARDMPRRAKGCVPAY